MKFTEEKVMPDIDLIHKNFDYDKYQQFGLKNGYCEYKKHVRDETGDFGVSSSEGYPDVSNYTFGFKSMIDHIFYSGRTLKLTAIKKMPNFEDLENYVGFPCEHFPSDHLPIGVELDYIE